jgi:hypothetical protein
MCRYIPLIRCPSEQLFVMSLLSAITTLISVTRSFVGGKCIASGYLIVMTVIKMV